MFPALTRRFAARPWARPLPVGAPTAGRVVAAVTVALAGAAAGYVLRFSVNAPVVDEWDLTFPLLGGEDPWRWVFSRLNEHRYPAANAAFVVLHKLTGLDFRAGMFATVAVLTAAAVLIAAAARRVRGRAHPADVLIPAVLLHWGHQYNLLMGYQLAFGLFVLAAAVLLRVVAAAEPGAEARTGTRAGLVLLFLMLNGGMGVAFVPPVAGWVAYLAWRVARAGGPGARWRAAGVLLPLVPAAWYAADTLLGTPKTDALPAATPPPGQFALAVAQYLGMGLGTWFPKVNLLAAGPAVGAAFLAAAGVLVAAVRRGDDRPRAVGLMAVLGGHLAVAVGIAAARGGAAVDRYATISAVGVLAAYLALVAYGPRLSRRTGVALGLAAAAAVAAANAGQGYRFGLIHRMYYRAFAADLKAGMPVDFLADKYRVPFLVNERFAGNIDRLRVNRVRGFAAAVPTPPLAAVPAPLPAPLTIPGCDDAGFASAPPGVDLPPPPAGRRVAGVRVTYELPTQLPFLELKVTWASPPGGPRRSAGVYAPTKPGRHTVAFWLDDAPAAARLVPGCPTGGLTVHAVEWLVPAESPPR